MFPIIAPSQEARKACNLHLKTGYIPCRVDHNNTSMKKQLIKSRLFPFAFLSLLVNNANSQDPEFSQFYSNPIYLNPALAGSHGCPRIKLNYRNQWPSVAGAFVTNSISYDQFVDPIQGGIGVQITNDMAGKNILNWTTLSLIYSYHLQVNRQFSLLFGGKATWNQKFLDWNKLTFGDQIDPRRGFVYQTGDMPSGNMLSNGWGTRGYFDASAGLVGFSNTFYFGAAVHHINQPNESMILGRSKMPFRLTGHIGAKIPIGSRSRFDNTTTSISPNIIYSYQNGFIQLNVGSYVQYGLFTAGAWWRKGDAFILTVGLDTGLLKFGYSYDITISGISNTTGGAHELSLGFHLECRDKPRRFRTIICPSF